MNMMFCTSRFRQLADALGVISASWESNNMYENKEESLTNLKEYFYNGGSDPRSFYQSTFLPFTVRYTFPNLVKNYFVIEELNKLNLLHRCKRILDLGCGPGNFALAYAIWAKGKPNFLKEGVTITMVDAVEEFLMFFGDLWRHIGGENQTNLKTKTIKKFIKGRFLDLSDNPDLIIFSNSLVEILRNPSVQTDKLIEDILLSGAIIAVIDYGYKSCSSYLKSFANQLKGNVTCLQVSNWPIKYNFYEAIDLGQINKLLVFDRKKHTVQKTKVKFLKSLWIPKVFENWDETSIASLIVAKYKQAWEKHDISLLKTLFAKDAIYIEKSDSEPFKGIGNICNYWNYNSCKQDHVKFHPTRIHYSHGTLITDWQCKLFRKDLRKWMYLNGKFHAKIKGKRIIRFSEKFEKVISEHPE